MLKSKQFDFTAHISDIDIVAITQQHHDFLLKHGFVIVPNFLTDQELTTAREFATILSNLR